MLLCVAAKIKLVPYSNAVLQLEQPTTMTFTTRPNNVRACNVIQLLKLHLLITSVINKITMCNNFPFYFSSQIFTGKNGDRPYAENILILLTDGKAHDIEKAYKEAKKMKTEKNRVRVVTIAAGANVSVKNLKKIASRKEDLLKVQYSDFHGFAEKVTSVVCNSSQKQQPDVNINKIQN